MTTLIGLMIWCGFEMSYLASRKIQPPKSWTTRRWLYQHPTAAKSFAAVSLCLSIWICTEILGLGSGILFFFIMLMTLGCLEILLNPLRIFNYKSLIAIALFCFILETVLS